MTAANGGRDLGPGLGAIVIAMTAVQAAATMGVLAISGLAPEVAATLQVSPSLIGYQVSIAYAGAMVSTIFSGAIVARYGAIRTSQMSMLICAAGCLGAGWATLWSIALGTFVVGLCYGLTNPSAAHLLARAASPGNRNLVFSIKQSGVPVGGALIGLIAPTIALALGWPSVPVAVAMTATALCLLLQPLRALDADRDPAARLRSSASSGIGYVWRTHPLRRLAFAFFSYAAVQLCLMSYAVTLLVEQASYSLVLAGTVLATLQIAGAVGRIAWGWLADRLGDGLAVLAAIGLITLGCCVATLFVAPAWPLIWVHVLFAVFGFCAVGWNGVAMAEIANVQPGGDVSSAVGGVFFYTYAGVLAGPALFAVLYTVLDNYGQVFACMAVLAAAGCYCVVAARNSRRKQAA